MSKAERFARSIDGADAARTAAALAFLIGKLEEVLALDEVPIIDGYSPRREALAAALERTHEALAAMKRRAS